MKTAVKHFTEVSYIFRNLKTNLNTLGTANINRTNILVFKLSKK